MLSKKELRGGAKSDSSLGGGRRVGDDGAQDRDQRQLFYEFSLDEMIPADHLLRRRGDGESLFLAEGRPIKRKTYCTRSNAGTDASDCIKQLYNTIRLRSVRIMSGYGMAACGAKRTMPECWI